LIAAALVLSVLAQQPRAPPPVREIAVLVSRRIGGVGEVRGQALARKVADFLKARGIEKVVDPAQSAKALTVLGVKDSAECDGKRECVSGLGRFLRAWAVVSVDLADVNDTMAMHFEAVISDTGDKLALLDLAIPSKKAEVELVNQLTPIAEVLEATLDELKKKEAVRPTPADAPVAARLEPEVPAQEVQKSPPMPGAHIGALVTTAGTVVAGALVVLFVAQASTAQRQLDNARVDRPNGAVGYNLTEDQARGLATRVNDNYTAALSVGIGAGALAIVSAILWAQK
jgi:hypothetical protein